MLTLLLGKRYKRYMGKGTKRTIDQGIRPHLQEETRTRRAELKKTTTTGPLTYPLGNCELDFP